MQAQLTKYNISRILASYPTPLKNPIWISAIPDPLRRRRRPHPHRIIPVIHSLKFQSALIRRTLHAHTILVWREERLLGV